MTVSVDGVLYFRVFDPICSVVNVSNADHATRLLAQTTLRNVLGTKSLSELLSDREGISYNMQVHELSEQQYRGTIMIPRPLNREGTPMEKLMNTYIYSFVTVLQ